MSLRIETKTALLGIQRTPAVQKITQPRGEQSIQQVEAKLVIDKELPRVHIDQYECFAEAGLKNNTDLTMENSNLARQTVLRTVQRIARQGDRMARIGGKISARRIIADIAVQNTQTELEYNIEFIPKSRPKIEVSGYLQLDWKLGGAENRFSPRKPVIDYQPGKVDVYLRRYGEIQISYVDEKV